MGFGVEGWGFSASGFWFRQVLRDFFVYREKANPWVSRGGGGLLFRVSGKRGPPQEKGGAESLEQALLRMLGLVHRFGLGVGDRFRSRSPLSSLLLCRRSPTLSTSTLTAAARSRNGSLHDYVGTVSARCWSNSFPENPASQDNWSEP